MSTLKLRLASIATAFAVVLTSYAPAQAVRMPIAPSISSETVVPAQYRRPRGGDWRGQRGRDWNSQRGRDWRGGQRSNPRWRDSARWRDGPRGGYFNGHRGYRDRRPGHRYHNGWWFPLAAFSMGAIIGGSMAQPVYPGPYAQPIGRHSIEHYRWCESRYRSYRASDNTFQPYNGPRRQCHSPYF